MSIIRNVVIGIVLWNLIKPKKDWIAPVQGVITSPFGMRIHPISNLPQMHNGIDIDGNEWDPIVAPRAGAVIAVYTKDKGGKQLKIRHDNGFISGFAHMVDWNVLQGMNVTQGAVIGFVGETGDVTGTHLHYTLKNEEGVYVNPEDFINFNQVA